MKKNLIWNIILIGMPVLFVVSLIVCITCSGTPAATAFAVIGGISLVGIIVSGLMVYRKRLLKQMFRNFTCSSCGSKFKWDEKQIECELLKTNTANLSNNKTVYHYEIGVKWTCGQCGSINKFYVTLTRDSICSEAMMKELVHKYYMGELLN